MTNLIDTFYPIVSEIRNEATNRERPDNFSGHGPDEWKHRTNKRPLHSIITEIVAAETDEEKVIMLRQHGDNAALKELLWYCYSPHIQWQLGDDDVPYKPAPADDRLALTLYGVVYRCYLATIGGREPNNVQTVEKRRQLWSEMLGQIHPADARLMECIRWQSIRGLSAEVVAEAFPGWLETLGTNAPAPSHPYHPVGSIGSEIARTEAYLQKLKERLGGS
jgi:hypothetical protein